MVMATILPHSHCARYTAGWSNTATSVASPFVIKSVDFGQPVPQTLTHKAMLQPGCFFAGVSRDPLNAIMEYVPNPNMLPIHYTGKMCTYNMTDPERTPIIDTIQWFAPVLSETHYLQPNFFEDQKVGDSSYLHPHGSRLYTKFSPRDSKLRYTFLVKGQTVNFTFHDQTGAPLILTGFVLDLRSNGDDYTEGQGAPLGGPISGWVAPECGYYAFAVTLSSVTGTPTSVGFTMNLMDAAGSPGAIGSYIGMRALPGIEDRTLLSGIRINGASIMITPDSAELARGGRIAGGQFAASFRADSIVKNAAGGSPNDLIANIPGASDIDFAHGGYAFHKPRTQDSYKQHIPFKNNDDYVPRAVEGFDTPSKVISSYHSEIEAPDGWLLYGVTTPEASLGSNTWPGGLCHVTYSFSVEYWNYDVWVEHRLPDEGVEEFNDVMQIVSHAPQFHENALHLSDLKRWYNGALPKLRQFGPGVLNLVAMAFPQLKPLMTVLANVPSVMPDKWD